MTIVLDISSDEEEGLKEEPEITDLEWLKEILFMSDEESDDSDEVVIVRENKPELKSKSSTLSVKDDVGDGDDDDCVVLEGDPENGVTSVEEDSTGSDELLVVGEKGQVACRDYPHARHLCANFPFYSTPHERHCDQCHCYVCDSVAPCLWWGTGILSSDHCHANDKTDLWKVQRKHFKLGQSSPLPASTNSASSSSVSHSQCNGNLPRRGIHLSPTSMFRNQASKSTAVHTRPSICSISQNQASRPSTMYSRSLSLNTGMQNQVSKPMNIPVCRTGTNLTTANGVNYVRSPESGSPLVRDRNGPHSVPKQLLGVRSHAIQRELRRGSHAIQRELRRGANSLGPKFLQPQMMSKGVVGSAGDTLTVNHSSGGSPGFHNHVSAVQHQTKFHTTTGFSNHVNCNVPGYVSHPINLSYLPHSSSGTASLSCVNQHTVTSESQDFHQTCIQGNSGPYMACLYSNQHGSELPIRSQNENTNGNITMQCGITSQDSCEPKPHEEGPNVTAERFSTIDSSWTENNSLSIDPVIECSLQSSVSISQPSNAEESSTQVTGNIEPMNEGSHLPSSIVDIENWLLDKDSAAPMVADGVLPFELNVPSPDLVPVDTGMLLSEWW